MPVTTSGPRCSNCGLVLAETPRVPCPKCGSTARIYDVHAQDDIRLKPSVAWTVTRKRVEKHPVYLAVTAVFTIGPPFLGLALAGWRGVVVGLVFGLVGFGVGTKAIKYVENIEKGGDRPL